MSLLSSICHWLFLLHHWKCLERVSIPIFEALCLIIAALIYSIQTIIQSSWIRTKQNPFLKIIQVWLYHLSIAKPHLSENTKMAAIYFSKALPLVDSLISFKIRTLLQASLGLTAGLQDSWLLTQLVKLPRRINEEHIMCKKSIRLALNSKEFCFFRPQDRQLVLCLTFFKIINFII